MDRNELEERIRTRKPGEGGLRRGTPLDEDERPTRSGGYAPFVPEPGDSMAVREEEPPEPAPNVDNTPPDFDQPRHEASANAPVAPPDDPEEPADEYESAAYPEDEAPYGAPEDAYPYPYQPSRDGRRRGPSFLPIIGFILLCVLALGVGAALASMLGGSGGIGEASPTPTAQASLPASVEPTAVPSESASDEASATPEPTDGPITFPDGAQVAIQPCDTNDFDDDAVGQPEADACTGDSSSFNEGEVWVFLVFADTGGSDLLTVQLLEDGQVQNELEITVESVLDDCGPTCSGLIYGPHYVGLFPGEYELVVRRDDDFADAATFTVED